MDFKEIVKDYELNFHGKTCTLSTNYNSLPEFTVVFDLKDLYHLLGIHKLKTEFRAREWLVAVKKDFFDLKSYQSSPYFEDVRTRVRNYEFFYEIFYQDKVKVCVLDKDLNRNTMQLSIVFYKNEQKRVVIMGLKKDNRGFFHPATLHERRNNPYQKNKLTMIKSVSWKVDI